MTKLMLDPQELRIEARAEHQQTDLIARAYDRLNAVVSPDGIRASVDFRFNHLFARDTFISAHFISAAHRLSPNVELSGRTRAGVLRLWEFQREDGKTRHEIRAYDPAIFEQYNGFYHRVGEHMANDDTIDGTPLALSVTPEFLTSPAELEAFLPRAKMALSWMNGNMDENGGFLRYHYNPKGLTHHMWMDSQYGVLHTDGTLPPDPIAPVETQAFVWKALRMWADLLGNADLRIRADRLKEQFNETFRMEDAKGVYFAHAIDGEDKQVKSVSINPGLALWASYKGESIIDKQYVPAIVERFMGDGFFDSEAGIRTFESGQAVFDPEDAKHGAYHNGKNVYWPFTTLIVAEAMWNLGYKDNAVKIINANFKAISHFGSFVEQFSKNGKYTLFRNGGEHGSCKDQTWTIASALWAAHLLDQMQQKAAA